MSNSALLMIVGLVAGLAIAQFLLGIIVGARFDRVRQTRRAAPPAGDRVANAPPAVLPGPPTLPSSPPGQAAAPGSTTPIAPDGLAQSEPPARTSAAGQAAERSPSEPALEDSDTSRPGDDAGWFDQLQRAERRLKQQSLELAAQRAAARTDALTGVANRRGFDDDLALRTTEAATRGIALSLVLFDVDHFKRFNDVHGHPAGDHVLKSLAQALRAVIRPSDTLARYGGEEFAILLPGASLIDATSIAQRLRQAVEQCRFHFDGADRPVTISVGVAQMEVDESAQSLIQRADTALYSAKSDGRNCVFFSDGLRARRAHLMPQTARAAAGAKEAAATQAAAGQSAATCVGGGLSIDDLCADLRRRLAEVAGFERSAGV